jgi:hypothetical protein
VEGAAQLGVGVVLTAAQPGVDVVDGGERAREGLLAGRSAVTDPPAGEKGMFGKIMSLPDDVMDSYYLLLTEIAGEDYRALIRTSPRDAKVRLAREVIGWLHSPAAAEEAEAAFRRQFVEKQVPTDMPEVSVGPGPHRLSALLVKAGLAVSNGEATRKVKEGAVDVDQGPGCGGLAGGMVGVVLVTRFVRDLLYGVAPFDPVALGIAFVVLVGCAMVALLVPVRRATRVDPITVLR